MKPITSDQYRLRAERPLSIVIARDKVKSVFGIEMPHWRNQLRACLQEIALPPRSPGAKIRS